MYVKSRLGLKRFFVFPESNFFFGGSNGDNESISIDDKTADIKRTIGQLETYFDNQAENLNLKNLYC